MTNSRTYTKKNKNASKGTPAQDPDTAIFLSITFEQSVEAKDEFGGSINYDENFKKWYMLPDCKLKKLILAKYQQVDKDAFPIDETPEEDRIYINVPYSRLDEAKSIGGIRFNKEYKLWYLVKGGETNDAQLELFDIVEF